MRGSDSIDGAATELGTVPLVEGGDVEREPDTVEAVAGEEQEKPGRLVGELSAAKPVVRRDRPLQHSRREPASLPPADSPVQLDSGERGVMELEVKLR